MTDKEATPAPMQIGVSTVFGLEQERAFVIVSLGEHSTLLTPEDARSMGTFIMQCAATADYETSLFRELVKKVGWPVQQFVTLLKHIKMGGVEPTATPPTPEPTPLRKLHIPFHN